MNSQNGHFLQTEYKKPGSLSNSSHLGMKITFLCGCHVYSCGLPDLKTTGIFFHY